MRPSKMMAMSVLMAVLVCVSVQAQPGHGPGRRGPVAPGPRRVITRPPSGARHIIVSGNPYWVYGGVYYRMSGGEYIIVSAPIVNRLPRHHRVVVIGGVVYYEADDLYYRTAPGGYIIVEKPIETVKIVSPKPMIPQNKPDEVTLYVPRRSAEGFVAVTLRKIEGGFLGPQGEFFPVMPPVTLLTEMYGVDETLRNIRSDVFFIHVPNKEGSGFTRVTLRRHDRGFIGPQGEFYPLMPSVAHLTEMYGIPNQTIDTRQSVIQIRVPRANGQGFVDVELKRHEEGYLGPQGEWYAELPSADRLVDLYGRD